ncbi:unnamed protein product [Clonostachys rhizophaga]|uniref:Uncharacterized protein n=1 Tax=Clonostachys rhizophaga TaxID=160324 RepID=A0A9N9V1G1_9HYPO|nr:unnamed protein product [Clonostachys rhizophaga]
MAIFRLINHILETDAKRSKWDAEYYGTTTTHAAIEQQRYHPTRYAAAPGALPEQRRSCRELKQELRAERRRRKAERVAVRRERRDCRRGGGCCRRRQRDAATVFAPETVPFGSVRTQQLLHEGGRQNYHHTDSVPAARSEQVRVSGQHLPRRQPPVDHVGDGGMEEAPPAYEKVQTVH